MAVSSPLPTLYEHYTSGGIASSLSANQPHFTLNDRNITLYSGAMHYFRVPKQYWRDRLRKMRAAGLNTVETYVPWNLHEPEQGAFDFGSGGSDMEEFLDVAEFLKTAKEEDLLAIVRPGPYICSEWEFGGFPSWLLRDKNVKIRTAQGTFMEYVTRYFNVLLPILAAFQFSKGGPIIAMQVENEYGSTEQPGKFMPNKLYLEKLRQLFLQHGIVELLFTSDSPSGHGSVGTLPEYFLQTANFAGDPEKEFDRLKQLQKDKPTMAMEFWSGWFDHWSEQHHLRDDGDFGDVYERILKYPASVNLYMFHGGTNWGFLNGANIQGASTDNRGFQPDTTSYDYDAPLTEAGDYTEKYTIAKNLIDKYNPVKTRIPLTPPVIPRTVYPKQIIQGQLEFAQILEQAPHHLQSERLIPMEALDINNGSGQSYGYIVYRKTGIDLDPHSTLTIAGRVCDSVSVLVNGILVSKPLTRKEDLNGFGYWRVSNASLTLGSESLKQARIELLVENWGRNNFGTLDQFLQYKGLWQGGVFLNDQEMLDWEIIPLEFKREWTSKLTGWQTPVNPWMPRPALHRATFFTLDPKDTYIDMTEWTKGVVIVNGFVLGRHASVLGPQQTLYLPAPLQRKGENEIVVFEHFYSAKSLSFSKDPIFRNPVRPVVLSNQ